MHPFVRTERLDLEPLTLEDAALLADGAASPEGRWADGYPTDGTLVAAGFLLAADRERRNLGVFRTYQIVRRSDREIIGDCGFLGPPDRAGIVHVAFGVARSARRRGYATEALEALIGLAFTDDRVSSVRAEASRDDIASRRVMGKAGMALVGEDGDTLFFEA